MTRERLRGANHDDPAKQPPFAGLTSDIDEQKPWGHAGNRAEIRKLVPLMLNPGLRPLVLRDANGYGVSHYAGNTHLFDHPGRLSLSDIGDGTANTLLIGEVCADFPTNKTHTFVAGFGQTGGEAQPQSWVLIVSLRFTAIAHAPHTARFC